MAKEPNRVGTAAKWTASVGGALVIVAVQTPPDVAASNAALWVQKITGYLPDWPHWVDVLATVIGVLLLLTPLIVWLWRKWRNRPGTIDDWLRSSKRPDSSALTDEDLAAGIGSKASRRRQKASPQPSIWDVIEDRQRAGRPTILDQMIDGKIGTPQDELIRKAAARTAYEMRKLTGGIGDPIAFGARLLDEDARASAEAAQRSRRRALIAKGRDVVIRWRRSDRSQPFEIFASQDRDYLDVQPHLGDEYQRERIRDADSIIYGPAHDENRVAALLQELTRLQKEWNLD
jgi:hypothetical protein